MSQLPPPPAVPEPGFEAFRRLVAERVAAVRGPLFTTDADPDALWELYLSHLDPGSRRTHDCQTCRAFVGRFGRLVTIDAEGAAASPLWGPEDVPAFFAAATDALRAAVEGARVTGVFLTEADTWGRPEAGGWPHLAGTAPATYRHDPLRSASQVMAEKREDFAMVSRALAEYPAAVVEQADRVLKAEVLHGAEKARGIAAWFLALHRDVEGRKGPRRTNRVWAAVATAPPGFSHVRSTIIATLLDDLVEGLPFDAVSRRWAEKTHPLQYQRPSAPPTDGAVSQAEAMVALLEVERSLERRFATLDDVQVKLWTPRAAEEEAPAEDGVFAHLRPRQDQHSSLDLPETVITWEKFARTVLPDALSMEVRVPWKGNFYGLVTAVHDDAPPILQWDGLEGQPRNPVSWYLYHGGSDAERWGLRGGRGAPVTAVFLSPHQWHRPGGFPHQRSHVFFAVEGCRDPHMRSLALFPETLQARFRGIRRVIEAHSQSRGLQGAEAGNANGLALQRFGGDQPITVAVRTALGAAAYVIDRWD